MDYRILDDMNTLLEVRGISKEELAESIGVSRMSVNNWLEEKKAIRETNV
nr:helix-turn-helix domain-containing protein [Lachnospiraceae bacterium]